MTGTFWRRPRAWRRAALYVNGKPFWGASIPLCRALGNAFPGFMSEGRIVNRAAIIGTRVIIAVDALGWILGLLPEEEHSEPEFATEVR